MATRRITARYRNGVFVPDEEVELEEGCQATLEVDEASSDQASSSSWLQDLVTEIHRRHPPETWRERPTDFVRHKKHYLYGHPKHPDD